MDIDDAEMVALIDGELDETRRRALLSRIAEDAALRERHEALREQRAAIRTALDALLPQAPTERLKAMARSDDASRRPTAFFRRIALRELAAGIVIGFALAAGTWMALTLSGGEKEDWRSAVVEYMGLYTKETFTGIPDNPEARAQELSAVGARVGARLTPEAVTLPGLDLKLAFILAYQNRPLGEIVQVDPAGRPVLFCIIADESGDMPLKSETRDRFSLASWSRGGKGYLVIAHLPEAQVAGYAGALQARF